MLVIFLSYVSFPSLLPDSLVKWSKQIEEHLISGVMRTESYEAANIYTLLVGFQYKFQ